jgi:hypothetical protein
MQRAATTQQPQQSNSKVELSRWSLLHEVIDLSTLKSTARSPKSLHAFEMSVAKLEAPLVRFAVSALPVGTT